MIKNTFIFLPRFTLEKEQKLWQNGILTWEDFLRAKKIPGIPYYKKTYFDRMILEARKQLYQQNVEYFYYNLLQSEHWRLYDFLKEDCCYLDIETTGLGKFCRITVIGLFNGINTKTMIDGINLDFNVLKNELKKYSMIVTFNGSTFDLPIIERNYPGLLPKIPHFDLKHGCARVGLKGGLKKIEKDLGIFRTNKIIENFYGGDALRLWKMWKASGDDYYLKLLVEYNEEDCVNLKKIGEVVYNKLKNESLK